MNGAQHCPECGSKMSIKDTGHGGGRTFRIAECPCGIRVETEECQVRRLRPHMPGMAPVAVKAPPPTPTPVSPPVSAEGVGGGLPEGSDQKSESGPISPADPIRGRARSKPKAETPAFIAFYASYPRKERRPAAFRAWLSQGCEPIAETVMIGLKRWQPEFARRKAKDPSTVPHPATWLNGWQWEDEPPTAVTPISAVPPWKQAERDEEARKRREASEEAKAMSEMKRALGR